MYINSVIESCHTRCQIDLRRHRRSNTILQLVLVHMSRSKNGGIKLASNSIHPPDLVCRDAPCTRRQNVERLTTHSYCVGSGLGSAPGTILTPSSCKSQTAICCSSNNTGSQAALTLREDNLLGISTWHQLSISLFWLVKSTRITRLQVGS